MDFSGRDVQHRPQSAAPVASSAAGAGGNGGSNFSSHGHGGSRKRKGMRDKLDWARVAIVLAVVSVAILICAVIVVVIAGENSVKAEDKYVDTNKLQAVFLNTGQVYFGNIQSLNDKYFVLTNIYYLQAGNSSSSSAKTNSSSNVTLVKLGCELHRPYDQMVINSSEVTFWENLQSDGQVAKAVATFEKDNPNGQKCVDQSNSASSTSGSSAQNATSSSSTPAPSSSGAKH